MKIVKSNGSIRITSLRRALGLPSRAASGFNACVAGKLRGKTYATPPVGMGGFHNTAVRDAFSAAARECKGMGGGAKKSKKSAK